LGLDPVSPHFPIKPLGKAMIQDQPPTIHKVADGEIEIWLDPAGGICLKAQNKFNDPIELSEHEATSLAELLTLLVKKQTER
jgi:hypothetical protein